ncbi:MAG: helix-turn-helix transcriptional regulator [Oscillospiraceae bacterium]|nr:helix-turn-helix transcriptional regulator [Oscillospiraceae bacterium]
MDYSESIEKTKEFIAAHLSEELTAEIIAGEAGYSVFHYCRVFKEYTGKCLMTYVREKRLDAAKEKIKKGITAAEAAFECGFETPSGFYRAFERKFGERPTKRMHA